MELNVLHSLALTAVALLLIEFPGKQKKEKARWFPRPKISQTAAKLSKTAVTVLRPLFTLESFFSLPVSFGQERLLLATKFSHGMGEFKSGKPNLK